MLLIAGIYIPGDFASAYCTGTGCYSSSLYIYKTVDRSYIQSTTGGEILVYSIHYQNTGSSRTTNTNIIDDFDDTKLAMHDSSGGTVSGGVISWNLGNIEPGVSGTKYFKVKIKDNLAQGTTYIYNKASIASSETGYQESNSVTVQFVNNYNYSSPSITLRVNGNDGPITVAPNTSITLTWNSTNATSCNASGDWSGTKSLSGSENLGYITSSKTYALSCSGPGGYFSDTVNVNVSNQNNDPYYISGVPAPCTGSTCGTITIEKTGRNLSDNSKQWVHVIPADAGEIILFQIKVTGNNAYNSGNVIVKDVLPQYLTYRGNLLVNNTPMVGGTGNIFSSGLNLGTLSANQTKVITFEAQVDSSISQTMQLKNTATVSNGYSSASDNAVVCITKKRIVTIPTYISTGITDNFLLDLFILPLALTLLIIWLLKSKIIRFEEWRELCREKYQDYKSAKLLNWKINQIRNKELK